MSEEINEWFRVKLDGWVDQWMDCSVHMKIKWWDGWLKGWMDGLIEEQMHEYMNEWMHGQMDECIDRRKGRWINESLNRWINKCIHILVSGLWMEPTQIYLNCDFCHIASVWEKEKPGFLSHFCHFLSDFPEFLKLYAF